jgi:hypothetical protein
MGLLKQPVKDLRQGPLINASTIRKTKVFEDECSEDKKYKEGKTVISFCRWELYCKVLRT